MNENNFLHCLLFAIINNYSRQISNIGAVLSVNACIYEFEYYNNHINNNNHIEP